MTENLVTSRAAGPRTAPMPAHTRPQSPGGAGLERGKEPFLSVRAWAILSAILIPYFVASYLTMLLPDHTHRLRIHEHHLIEGPGSLGLLTGSIFACLVFRRTPDPRYAQAWPRLRR